MLTILLSIFNGLPEATTSMFLTFRAAPKRRVLIFIIYPLLNLKSAVHHSVFG